MKAKGVCLLPVLALLMAEDADYPCGENFQICLPPGITMCCFHVITDLLKFSFWYTGNNVSICKV